MAAIEWDRVTDQIVSHAVRLDSLALELRLAAQRIEDAIPGHNDDPAKLQTAAIELHAAAERAIRAGVAVNGVAEIYESLHLLSQHVRVGT